MTWSLSKAAAGAVLLVICTVSCGGSAREACEDYKEAFKAFYWSKCEVVTAVSLIPYIEVIDCGQVVGVRDEEALYQECFPALEELTCDLATAIPASCQQQFYFSAPPVF